MGKGVLNNSEQFRDADFKSSKAMLIVLGKVII